MNNSDSQRIADIFEFANELTLYVAEGYDKFLARGGSRRAIERLIEIIGETSSHLSEELKLQLPDINWAGIIGMRLILAHAYHRVENDTVWVVATERVPELVRQLKKLTQTNH
ncbi:MAG: HepT-like ribonuclease domain-containing protein [Actinomycetota bacterium]